jgi:hypothetical protein
MAKESLQEETAVTVHENNGGNSFLTVADDLEALENTAFMEEKEQQLGLLSNI